MYTIKVQSRTMEFPAKKLDKMTINKMIQKLSDNLDPSTQEEEGVTNEKIYVLEGHGVPVKMLVMIKIGN